ncbi:MAG: heme lyase CcmF/NrfE family subunit [Actinobacteria bacterium]|nr:heme lyase CcmF/NrfE family subunit [Actinomycetota bacterium]
MANIGSGSLLIAFIVAVFTACAGFGAATWKSVPLYKSAKRGSVVLFLFISTSILALIYLLITRDFSIKYVASYTSKSLPLFYTISAVWAGQAGSLLFWAWLISFFTIIVLRTNRGKEQQQLAYIVGILASVAVFFIMLLVFATNPFARMSTPPQDGMGMNPMLINPGMVFHPPTLYLGYVGFTIPFAFAIAALLTGRLDARWIKTTRRWTIMSWIFLTIGNLFGAYWAYVELGWGGYWAWDPVENAGILPWLTGTAFLHSVMIQEKRGMLKVWNIVLIIVTFALTIFGTFITRSGIISSVHSFGVSNLGPFFIAFLAVLLVFSFLLLFYRRTALRSSHQLDSFISKESTFLYNNLLLAGLAFAIFWGTIFPIISEAVRGVKITVGPPFFNQVAVPIGLALLLLTGVCSLISWRKATVHNLLRRFITPLIVAALSFVLFLIIGLRSFYAIISLTLSTFVLTTILIEFFNGARTRAIMRSEHVLLALWRLVLHNKRRYGGYIIHIGVIMVFVGITGSTAFKKEIVATIKPGDSISIANYKLKYEDIAANQRKDYQAITARLSIKRNDKIVAELLPQKRFYQGKEVTTEVDIFKSLREDLYVILADYDQSKKATFKVLYNPLVSWLWYGGFMMILGGLIAIGPDRRKPRKKTRNPRAAASFVSEELAVPRHDEIYG